MGFEAGLEQQALFVLRSSHLGVLDMDCLFSWRALLLITADLPTAKLD